MSRMYGKLIRASTAKVRYPRVLSVSRALSQSSLGVHTASIRRSDFQTSHRMADDRTGGTIAASATQGDTAPPQNRDEVLLQYVVLRKDLWKDLNWPLGSIVAQGCHAATAALWLSRDEAITQQYCSPENLDHMHKVCPGTCKP